MGGGGRRWRGSHCCPPPPMAVLTGTVKSLSRDPQVGGGAAVVTVLSAYKMAEGLGPPPPKGTTLRVELQCGQCPALKKGGGPPDPPPETPPQIPSPITTTPLTPPPDLHPHP